MDSGIPDMETETPSADAEGRETDSFVYFVDPRELAPLVPGWPEELRLLICMDAAGLCEFVVFHEGEAETIFARVADILDRPVGEFAVSPYVEGHPQRRLLFSEENALLKSIQESRSLLEFATDYLINYNFAREEGLDFDKLMRPKPTAEEARGFRVTTGKILPLASRSRHKQRKVQPGVPEGYAVVDDVALEDCYYLGLEMWVTGRRVRIAASAERPLSSVPMLARAREVAFRDDFSSVYLPRDVLPKHWKPQDELAIDIPVELFPIGYADNCVRRKVQVAVTPRGLFVEFGALVSTALPMVQPQATLERELASPVKSRKRPFLRTFYIPLIAVLGLGVTGLFSTIIAQTTGGPGAGVAVLGDAVSAGSP